MFKSYTRAADEIPLRAERACFRDFYTVPIANPSFISVRKECKGKLRIHRCYAYKENRGTCSIHFIREVVLRETSRTNSKEMKELLSYMSRHHEDLEKSFTDEQKEIFEKFHDCWSEYMSLGEAAIFKYAFKLGMQIAIEALTE